MALKIVDQFPFEFYGEQFTVGLGNDRKLYVPMQALCKAMGLQTHGQVRRIRENEATADALEKQLDDERQARLEAEKQSANLSGRLEAMENRRPWRRFWES